MIKKLSMVIPIMIRLCDTFDVAVDVVVCDVSAADDICDVAVDDVVIARARIGLHDRATAIVENLSSAHLRNGASKSRALHLH